MAGRKMGIQSVVCNSSFAYAFRILSEQHNYIHMPHHLRGMCSKMRAKNHEPGSRKQNYAMRPFFVLTYFF